MSLFPRLPEPLTAVTLAVLVTLLLCIGVGWLIDRETPKGRHHPRHYYRRVPGWLAKPWLYIPETRAELALRDRLSRLRGLLRGALDGLSGEEYVPETWDPYAGDRPLSAGEKDPGAPWCPGCGFANYSAGPCEVCGAEPGHPYPVDKSGIGLVARSRQSGDLDDTIHDAPPRIVEPSRNILEVSAYAAERQRLTLFYERVRAGAAW